MIPSFKWLITSSLSISFLVSTATTLTLLILPSPLQHAAQHNCSREKSPKGIVLSGLCSAFQEAPSQFKSEVKKSGHMDTRGLSWMYPGGLWSASMVIAQLRVMTKLLTPRENNNNNFFVHLNIILLCWHMYFESFHCEYLLAVELFQVLLNTSLWWDFPCFQKVFCFFPNSILPVSDCCLIPVVYGHPGTSAVLGTQY